MNKIIPRAYNKYPTTNSVVGMIRVALSWELASQACSTSRVVRVARANETANDAMGETKRFVKCCDRRGEVVRRASIGRK